MTRNSIRILTVLAAILFVGIIASQLMFLRMAYQFQEKITDQNIQKALQRTRRDLLHHYNPTENAIAVKQLSAQYYVVNTSYRLHPDTLKFHLKEELNKVGITSDFQFAIYDTLQHKLVFGDYISAGQTDQRAHAVKGMPVYAYNQHYFCIYFPHATALILRELKIWIISSVLLLVIVVFFGYSIYTILKQKRLSEIQRDFVNNMTHEFQTPISTIYISSEVLKDASIINQPQRLFGYATIIQEEAMRLKNQVESILQVAKLDKQKIHLQKEKIYIQELLCKVADYVLQSHAVLSDSNITYNLAPDMPAIQADPLHLFNIVYNLLDNAIKYSEHPVAITINAYPQKRGVEFQVKDEGKGLKKSDLTKIFHKFYRTENSSSSKGFGIGLYYVKLVVSAHGGYVTVESEPGEGSTFSVYLPA